MTAPARSASGGATPIQRRRRFGLDTLLPADPAVIEAEILRFLARLDPAVIIVRPSPAPDRPPPAGHRPVPAFVPGPPDLLLLLPGGRTACLKIRTQAMRLTRDQASFGELCTQRGIPFAVVRSVAEARHALARLGLSDKEDA